MSGKTFVMTHSAFKSVFCLILAMTGISGSALGNDQDLGALKRGAEQWLTQEAAEGLPTARAKVRMGQIDDRLRLPVCPAPIYFLPAGARLWGAGSIGIRCAAPAKWSLYLGYQIQLTGPALVARHPLPARLALGTGDAALAQVDYVTNPSAYLQSLPPGAMVNRPVPAGAPILLDWMVLPQVIHAGRKVRLLVSGTNYSVVQQGTALNSAQNGEMVRVKTGSGRIVQGIANQEGEVEIRP